MLSKCNSILILFEAGAIIGTPIRVQFAFVFFQHSKPLLGIKLHYYSSAWKLDQLAKLIVGILNLFKRF